MQTLLRGLLLAILFTATGCAAVAINGGTLAAKSISRAELTELAEQGDLEAQYELGRSHCCMGVGFSTQIATEWYCKAAARGHSGAMYELGRIYMGDISRTPAPLQKVMRAVTAERSEPHAYYWLARAAEQGHAKAGERLQELITDTNGDEIQPITAATIAAQPAECTYSEVFSQS